MKKRMMMCRRCKIETLHRVRQVCYKPHKAMGSRGGVKYIVEHCTRCNRRWYNGKLKGYIPVVREKKKKHIKI